MRQLGALIARAGVSERGQLGEAGSSRTTVSYARRQALGRILRPRIETIQDNTLGHAYRATNFLGLGAGAATRWAAISSRATPKCLDALEAGDADRIVLLAGTFINELLAAGFQRFAVKPLVNLRFSARVARGGGAREC